MHEGAWLCPSPFSCVFPTRVRGFSFFFAIWVKGKLTCFAWAAFSPSATLLHPLSLLVSLMNGHYQTRQCADRMSRMQQQQQQFPDDRAVTPPAPAPAPAPAHVYDAWAAATATGVRAFLVSSYMRSLLAKSSAAVRTLWMSLLRMPL